MLSSSSASTTAWATRARRSWFDTSSAVEDLPTPAGPAITTTSITCPDCTTPIGKAVLGSLRHDVRELSGRLVLEDHLPAAVRHLLLLDHRPAVVLAPRALDPRHAAAAPVVELNRLPPAGSRRGVAGVHHGVHDVAVVEGLRRSTAVVEGVEHVGEHVDVAEFRHLVADREQPAGGGLGLLRHVAALAGREHLEAGAEEVVRPDRALRAGHLVAQVHPAAEGPRDLELADCAGLELDQRDRVVLRLDRVDQRVHPRHHLERAVVLSHVAAHDLDAVAAE